MSEYFRKMATNLFKSRPQNVQELNSVIEKDYAPLTPTNTADAADEYVKAIEWALRNNDKIKNIAITGPYGSGKSSVIQTFQEIHKDNAEYKFLNISLATFKDEKRSKKTDPASGPEVDNPQNDEKLRLIELSILQQIFYRENQDQVPDSRFARIIKRSKSRMLLESLGLTATILSFTYLIYPDFFKKFQVFEVQLMQETTARQLSVCILCFALFFMIRGIIGAAKELFIKKVSINNSEIEIDQKISKSILNSHLDEILYFFEVTEYNVVVIEDLDRFEQTEVFTKLRELNLLLNNSKNINTKKKVVFVYAIRDEMFQNKDRAKFFDFIIPIIPVINSSNSSDKLLKIRDDNKYKLSNELINDVSMFIDDMRLLNNVANEYHIYSKKIVNKNQDKIFGMILYKNMYPEDFTHLNRNEGILYTTISDKSKYMRAEIEKLDNLITQERLRIKEIEEVSIKNINELRLLYLGAIVRKITETRNAPFFAFYFQDGIQKINSLVAEEKFNYLTTNLSTVEFLTLASLNNRPQVGIKFSDVETEVDPKHTFKERVSIITESELKVLNSKRKHIEDLERKKLSVKKKRIKNLIEDNKIAVSIESVKDVGQNKLLNVLLRKGYIDEDYLDCISIFYEGNLVKSDFDFLASVKSQSEYRFDQKLEKIDNLINKLEVYEFEKPFSLNYSLVEHVLNSEKFQAVQETIFKQLSDGSEVSLSFLDAYVFQYDESGKFIKSLCRHWHGIWSYIENDSEFTLEKKLDYLKRILIYSDIADLVKVFVGFEEVLEQHSELVLLEVGIEKLKQIINKLNLKIVQINKNISSDLLNFIYEGSHYEINSYNLHFLLQKLDTGNVKHFYTSNFSSIETSALLKMKAYIQDNIDDYVEKVYLKLELNKEESEPHLVMLLNDTSISIDLRESIVEFTLTKVAALSAIEEVEIIDLLMKYSKAVASWENVVTAYSKNEKSFSDEMITFLNEVDNTNILTKKRISKSFPDEETANKFMQSLLLENRLHIEPYAKLITSDVYIYNTIDLSDMSDDKVEALISKRKLAVNKTNFEHLKENFEDLKIKLLESNEKKFIEGMGTFSLDSADVAEIVSSKNLGTIAKESVIALKQFDFYRGDQDAINAIATLLLADRTLKIENPFIVELIISNTLPTNEKIKIFISKEELFDQATTTRFLETLKDPYCNIAKYGKMPKIEKTLVNQEFAQILKDKDYISSFRESFLDKKIVVATKRKQ